MLKEVKEQESAILTQLSQLKRLTKPKEHKQLKDELLKQRKGNLEKLKIIMKKMAQLFSSGKKQSPNGTSQNPINPGGQTI